MSTCVFKNRFSNIMASIRQQRWIFFFLLLCQQIIQTYSAYEVLHDFYSSEFDPKYLQKIFLFPSFHFVYLLVSWRSMNFKKFQTWLKTYTLCHSIGNSIADSISAIGLNDPHFWLNVEWKRRSFDGILFSHHLTQARPTNVVTTNNPNRNSISFSFDPTRKWF